MSSFPRIVATDLDGTLLSDAGTVTPRTRQALQAARAAGAEIVFVTARAPRGVRGIARQAGVSGTAICSNGAVVYDLATDEITHQYPLDPRTARQVAQALALALPGVGLAVETGRNILVEAAYTRRIEHDVAFYREVESVFDEDRPIVKLLALSPAHTADEMYAAVAASIGDLAEVTYSGMEGLLEISAAGVTKAVTLGRLCAERGVEAGDVVAFGDMPNDLAVLLYAGAGYAMANAHPMVLSAAGHRTLSNDEDGVAVVLENLLAAR
ncbi:HMP-PP hydrolase (pyridoxal phosphatase) Cof, detected in genetic screen for thiamin metabolic genes (PMID:15292217) [[Actinomadura] parvosata subsp. kistnae]|uniref:HAD family hydrolase n=1 Tax=[Actinomadura] parvosata TaxID=1955412 RepID=UPI000D2B6568|nr:HAD family hydrolase [Nonomuraea sp. ATCC 55076]SPL90574.1 HMP-PP hydrolase (pyridoxal phosphatase) Cof, detected in genetic screen for thiamin metabolic genes (PMID:15292217) [Actinomadura parvosata subsp. kistnae]